MERQISGDMDSPYDMEATECSIITTESTVSPNLITASTYTHYLIKILLCCVDPDSVKPDMDYLPETLHSNDYGQWGNTYHGHYNLLAGKDYGVKCFICRCGTENPEYAHDGHHLLLSVNFQDAI